MFKPKTLAGNVCCEGVCLGICIFKQHVHFTKRRCKNIINLLPIISIARIGAEIMIGALYLASLLAMTYLFHETM